MGNLPKGILAVALGKAEANFHARLDAMRKVYSYRLAISTPTPFEERFCWHVGSLNISLLTRAAGLLNDTVLDYSSFTKVNTLNYNPDYHGDLQKRVTLTVYRER